jgi:hypothetical protein
VVKPSDGLQVILSVLGFFKNVGIAKQPTVQFFGVNLQVINGSGSESTLNGAGNLILGYDEKPGTQTGSHNLLLGASAAAMSEFLRRSRLELSSP